MADLGREYAAFREGAEASEAIDRLRALSASRQPQAAPAEPLRQRPRAPGEKPDPTMSRARSAMGSAVQGAADVVGSVPKAAAVAGRALGQASRADADDAVAALLDEKATLEGMIGRPPEHLSAMPLDEWNAGVMGRIAQVDQQLAMNEVTAEVGRLQAQTPVSETAMFQAGTAVQEGAAKLAPTDPAFEGDLFTDQVPRATGNMAAFVVTALTTGPVIVGLEGVTLGAASQYEEAIAFGADEETALKAAGLGGLVGTTELLPIMRALKPLAKVAPGARSRVVAALAKVAKSGTEEAAQEAMQTTLQNMIAQGLYDPDRETFQGAWEGALVGGIVGGGVGAIGAGRPPVDPGRRVDDGREAIRRAEDGGYPEEFNDGEVDGLLGDPGGDFTVQGPTGAAAVKAAGDAKAAREALDAAVADASRAADAATAFDGAAATSQMETGSADLVAGAHQIVGDSGGTKSYGFLGLNTRGALADFITANADLGLTARPGSAAFDAQWLAIPADQLAIAQQKFYAERIAKPAVDMAAGAGLGLLAADPRVAMMVSDLIVQYGPALAAKHVKAAVGAGSVGDVVAAITASTRASIRSDFRTYLAGGGSLRGLMNRISRRAALAMGGKLQNVASVASARRALEAAPDFATRKSALANLDAATKRVEAQGVLDRARAMGEAANDKAALSALIDQVRRGFDPEKGMRKRPVGDVIKGLGGIDPTSDAAAELRHIGVTPQSSPGLFRSGGLKDVDNLVASEFDVFDGMPEAVAEDGQYLDRETVLRALADEQSGAPMRSLAEQEAIYSNPAQALSDQLDALGIDVATASNADVMRALDVANEEAARLGAMDEADLAREISQAAGLDDVPAAPGPEDRFFINFARLNTTEDVEKLLQMTADADRAAIEKAGRGRVSHAQTLKESDKEYRDVEDLLGRAPGPMSGAQATAARRILVASGEQLLSLARHAASDGATSAQLYAFRRAMQVHYAIQTVVFAARRETARALNAWAIPVGSTSGRKARVSAMLTPRDDLVGHIAQNGDVMVTLPDGTETTASDAVKTADELEAVETVIAMCMVG